jgi:hypothetical protein
LFTRTPSSVDGLMVPSFRQAVGATSTIFVEPEEPENIQISCQSD